MFFIKIEYTNISVVILDTKHCEGRQLNLQIKVINIYHGSKCKSKDSGVAILKTHAEKVENEGMIGGEDTSNIMSKYYWHEQFIICKSVHYV